MTKALTAFLVVVPEDGPPYATDTPPPDLELTRPPSILDIRRATTEIGADLAAQTVAQYVLKFTEDNAPEPTSKKIARKVAERKVTPVAEAS